MWKPSGLVIGIQPWTLVLLVPFMDLYFCIFLVISFLSIIKAHNGQNNLTEDVNERNNAALSVWQLRTDSTEVNSYTKLTSKDMKQRKYKFLFDCTVGFSETHTTHLPVEHFLWLLMPVRLETTGHDHFTEPAAPRGWSQSFPFWPAVCACPARARRFLFGFLQEWVTFAMEDFVWSVASARAVMHSFLFLLHTGWRAESPSEDSHEVEEGLSDRKSNMLLEIYSIIFSKSIPLPREAMPRWVESLCAVTRKLQINVSHLKKKSFTLHIKLLPAGLCN